MSLEVYKVKRFRQDWTMSKLVSPSKFTTVEGSTLQC